MDAPRASAPPPPQDRPGSAFLGFAAGTAFAWLLALANMVPWILFDPESAAVGDFMDVVKTLALGTFLIPIVHTGLLWPIWRAAARNGRSRTARGLKLSAVLVAAAVGFLYVLDRLTAA